MTILLAVPGTVSAGDERVAIEGRYWMPDFSGKVRSSFSSGPSFEFDAESDLGIQDENFPDVMIRFRPWGEHRLRVGYTPIRYSGTGTLNRNVTFGGQTFTASTQVHSSIRADYVRAGWSWTFLKVPFSDIVRIGPLVEAKGFWVETKVESTGQSEQKSFPLVLPTLGAILEIKPHDSFEFVAEASGLPAGSYGYFLDAEAAARYWPIEHLGLTVGYRHTDIRVENDENFGRFTLSGPYAGAIVAF